MVICSLAAIVKIKGFLQFKCSYLKLFYYNQTLNTISSITLQIVNSHLEFYLRKSLQPLTADFLHHSLEFLG